MQLEMIIPQIQKASLIYESVHDFWFLLHMRQAKTQTIQHIHIVSPKSLLLAHTSRDAYECSEQIITLIAIFQHA